MAQTRSGRIPSRRPRVLLDLQALQSESRERGIGNYTAGLADALLKRGDCEWHVLLSSELDDALAEVRCWVEARLPHERIHVFHGLSPVAGLEPKSMARAQAAEILYGGFVASLDVDLLHVASPFDGWGDNTVVGWDLAPSRTARVATAYDFIPANEPDVFLPTQAARDWYERRLSGLASADAILAISDHTRDATLRITGKPSASVVNIGADVAPIFCPRVFSDAHKTRIFHSHGITRDFILHVGILEPRKNVPLLIRAFARLDPATRDKHQIVLATSFTYRQKAAILALRRSLGLPDDAIVMPGFVPDEQLANLYGLATVTVMPSRAEGFGLPLLEAMRCGCPVLGANSSSIPEVVGRSDLLFDLDERDSLTMKLAAVLNDEAFKADARRHSLDQARRFSWERSAELACALFLRTIDSGRSARNSSVFIDRHVPWHPERTKYKITFGARTRSSREKLSSAAETEQQAVFLNAMTAGDVAGTLGPPFLELQLKRDVPSHESSSASIDNAIGVLFPANARSAFTSTDGIGSLGQRFRASVSTWINEPVLRSAAPWGWCLSLNGRSRTDHADHPLVFGSLGDALSWVVDHHPLVLAHATIDRLMDTVDPRFLRDEAATVAAAVADNHAPIHRRKRLLVDVSELAQTDAKTGIQRVVRNIVGRLLAVPREFDVVPIYRDGDLYRYARTFVGRLAGSAHRANDTVADFRCDDTFLGLDLDAAIPDDAMRLLRRQHLRGVRIIHVVYDLLPIIHPDWFPPGTDRSFERWTDALGTFCDGIACISEATAEAVRDLSFERRIDVGVFHLGADLDAGAKPAVTGELSPPRLLAGVSGPVFATVGTVEPRKGHAQLLDAADELWARGVEVGFIIVGKQGWKVDKLASRIRSHPEFGQRLLWLEGANDDVLRQVYERASAALLPSQGEGFGLPVVEAARFGTPLLVRDLPVFREIARGDASYFEAENGRELADAISAWLDLFERNAAPRSGGVKALTWDESTEQLLSFVGSVSHRT